ncbi:ABC transporter permease [Dellaglioa sp. L3N]
MNFFKRALLNIKAKKGRSFLLVLVMSTIMLFMLIGLIIQNAAITAANDAKKSVGATVTLTANQEKAVSKKKTFGSKKSKTIANLSGVKMTTAKKIGALSNVKSYRIMTSVIADTDSFETVPSNQGTNDKKMKSSVTTGHIMISGVSETTSLLSSSGAKITEGRGLTASDLNTKNVVIESELASINHISVGNTIKLKSTGGKMYKVKVVGIYKASSNSIGKNASNTIYTAYTFANTVKGSKYKGTADSIIYTLNNPAELAVFTKKAKKLINPAQFSLSTDDRNYQSMLIPLNNIKRFAQKIILLVVISGTIILSLMIILMIRERRYEIGILLALGEKWWKIIAQFFVEMVMILIVSLAVAGIGGRVIGNVVGNQLINQQTAATTLTTSSDIQGGAQSDLADQSAITASQSVKLNRLNTTIKVKDLVVLGGMGLTIILVSIILASLSMLRFELNKRLNS